MTRTSREVMVYYRVVSPCGLCAVEVLLSRRAAPQIGRGGVYDEAIVGSRLMSSMSGNRQVYATI